MALRQSEGARRMTCDQVADMNGERVFDPFTVRVRQPDGTHLEHVVRVQH